MKKVLFPTDFSENANRALLCAISLLNNIPDVVLTLLHVYDVPTSSTPYVSVEGTIINRVESEMAQTVNFVQEKLAKDINLETLVVKSEPVTGICQTAEDFDWIIMGTQGATGLAAVFIGSTANGVIKHTTTPVLVIPQEYDFSPVKNIVLSIDDQPVKDISGVQILKNIAQAFQSDLMIFHTEEEPTDKGIHKQVLGLFNQAGISIDYNFAQQSVAKSIQEMVEDYEVDLLCLVRRKRGFLQKIIHQSVTSQEVYQSKIPLLILHD